MLKFSIILPTFNRAHMIHNAIESVLSQTRQDWELIIIDDGSIDDTKHLVEKYIKKDGRVKYFFQKNQERSAARNNGIKKAKGDWICFLDSDDFYHICHLEEFCNLINKNNGNKGIYFSGLSKGEYSEELEQYNMTFKSNLEFVILNTIGTPRACVHKEILLKYKFDEKIRNGEDRELWVRILKDFPLFFHKNKTFIEIEHPNRSINLESLKFSLKTLKHILTSNKPFIRRNVKKKALSNAYFNISKQEIKNQKIISAIFFLILSLIKSIFNNQSKHKFLLLISLFFNLNNKIVNEYK